MAMIQVIYTSLFTFVSTALLASRSLLLPAKAITILGSAWRCNSFTQAFALSKEDYIDIVLIQVFLLKYHINLQFVWYHIQLQRSLHYDSTWVPNSVRQTVSLCSVSLTHVHNTLYLSWPAVSLKTIWVTLSFYKDAWYLTKSRILQLYYHLMK